MIFPLAIEELDGLHCGGTGRGLGGTSGHLAIEELDGLHCGVWSRRQVPPRRWPRHRRTRWPPLRLLRRVRAGKEGPTPRHRRTRWPPLRLAGPGAVDSLDVDVLAIEELDGLHCGSPVPNALNVAISSASPSKNSMASIAASTGHMTRGRMCLTSPSKNSMASIAARRPRRREGRPILLLAIEELDGLHCGSPARAGQR